MANMAQQRETRRWVRIAGMSAPVAALLSLEQGIGRGASAAMENIAKAIDRAIARGAVVINLSLGADLHTNVEREAIGRAVAAGIVVVASAGNDGSLLPQFPAAYAGVLAVGAAGSRRQAWPRSRIVAPGSACMAPGCGAALDIATTSTTRSAAPPPRHRIVSGLAGLLKSVAPSARGQDIIAAIQRSAHPAEGSAHGIVDAAAALAAIKKVKAGSTGQTKGALLRLVRRPMISGVGAVGARLTASTGAWSGPITSIATSGSAAREQGKSCKTVSRHPNYRVVRADRGQGIRVVVRATGEDGIAVEAHSNLLPIRR